MSEQTLSNLSREERRFEPPADLAADANVKEEAYARADSDREAFWAAAADRLDWGQKWDQVLDWSNPPFAKWFVGGTITSKEPSAEERYTELEVRALTGAGAEQAVQH